MKNKIECFDISHRRDVVRECEGCPTLCASMGTGGNNIPIVLMNQAFRILSDKSNAMQSTNPNSGIKQVEISPTLDTSTPTPAKAQGGLAIVSESYSLAENTIGRQLQNGGNGTGYMKDKCYTLNATGVHGVCVPINTMIAQGRPSDNGRLGSGIGKDGQPQNTLSATHCHAVCFDGCVRRLTPIECERLQGFQDGYTQIPYRGKPKEQCPDSPRYKALGNSWAVPVVRWIGERINLALKEL